MFDWMKPTAPPKRARKAAAQKRDAMYKDELEDRASLLQRLGYSAEQARKRLRANVDWDFELHGKPRHAAEVDRVVDAVYRRGGKPGGAPSV